MDLGLREPNQLSFVPSVARSGYALIQRRLGWRSQVQVGVVEVLCAHNTFRQTNNIYTNSVKKNICTKRGLANRYMSTKQKKLHQSSLSGNARLYSSMQANSIQANKHVHIVCFLYSNPPQSFSVWRYWGEKNFHPISQTNT